MALPHLIKHVYNNGTDEVIRRGKKIHALGYVEMVEHDELMGSIVFRVKDDVYNTFYKVYIQKYADAKLISLRCSCPYNLGEICRHESAALFRLQDMVDKNMLMSSAIQYNQRHTIAKMKHIDLKMIKMLSSPSIYQEAETILRATKATIIKAADERVEAELIYNNERYPLVIQKTTKEILIHPAVVMNQCIHYVNTRQWFFFNCSMHLGPTILTVFVIWIKKKINCCRFMATV